MSVKARSCFRAGLAAKLLFGDSWIFMSFMFTLQLCTLGVYQPISMIFLLWEFYSPCEERQKMFPGT